MDSFSALKEGQWVKVKGMSENGNFVAHEVKIRPAGEQSVMEGKLQNVNADENAVSLMDVNLSLGKDIVIKNAAREAIELSALNAGEIIKAKGEYSAENGFQPVKLKLQEPKGVDYNELQGFINALENESKTIDVLGLKVAVNDNTEIEGF
jgi:hypothetical protein